MDVFFEWLKQNVASILAGMSTAAVLYWSFRDRSQKFHERQNEEFRKILNDKLYEDENKNLELEIVFRYCFNSLIAAHEVRWLLRRSVSLADLETYSYLKRAGVLKISENNEINFTGLLQYWLIRWFIAGIGVVSLLIILVFLLLILTVSFNSLIQTQTLESIHPSTFILVVSLVFLGFLLIDVVSSVIQGARLVEKYSP